MLWETQFGLRRFELCLRIHLRLGSGFSRTWGEISLCSWQALCFVCLCGSPGRTIFYVWKPTVTVRWAWFQNSRVGTTRSPEARTANPQSLLCLWFQVSIYNYVCNYFTLSNVLQCHFWFGSTSVQGGQLAFREDYWVVWLFLLSCLWWQTNKWQ